MRYGCWAMLFLLGSFALGCGGSNGPATYRVSGNVTLDGKPIDTGRITFKDPAGQAKSMEAPIKNGSYSFLCTAGKKKIEITSLRKVEGKQNKVGGNPGDPIGPNNSADIYEEAIPAQYNKDTTLEQEVKSSGSNTFNFDLKSK